MKSEKIPVLMGNCPKGLKILDMFSYVPVRTPTCGTHVLNQMHHSSDRKMCDQARRLKTILNVHRVLSGVL